MGCHRTTCSMCNGSYKACQLTEGKCSTCYEASLIQQVAVQQASSQNVIIEVTDKNSDNNVYYN